MYDRTATQDDENRESLSGIWLLGPKDLTRECEKLYQVANVLVRGLSEILGGRSNGIARIPRRSGPHSFPFHFAGDLAQTLRYARNEADMTADYQREVEDSVAVVLGSRAVDLMDMTAFEVRTVELPVPEFDWSVIRERVLGQIVLAARGRRLLATGKPLPLDMAIALSGWDEEQLRNFSTIESGRKLQIKKLKAGLFVNPETFDLALREIEEVFFDHRTYRPL